MNLCEVYYDFLRAADHATALAAPMIWSPQAWSKLGGHLKAHGRISLADCIGLALAAKRQATFLTADRHELGPVAARGNHAIQFIR